MTQSELEAALNVAFNKCAAASYPLNDRQKQILRQAVRDAMRLEMGRRGKGGDRIRSANAVGDDTGSNPLDQLATEERQAFLAFVQQQERQNQPWKITLLNDWLDGRNSGAVQFIRECYGIQWVEQITPGHLASYLNVEAGETLRLKVGDRIEVTNGLWEWVQETGPCSREWFPCTVVSIKQASAAIDAESVETEHAGEALGNNETSCTIRFEDGTEYEIQGVYDWNRPNWRWGEGGGVGSRE